MCNRANRYSDWSDIKIQLGFPDSGLAPNLEPSWNIAPTHQMLTAVHGAASGNRVPALMHWGLIPSWSKDGKLMATTFNARGEDIETKPMWRGPWAAKRRCLIIVDGFYEWQWLDDKGKQKQPYAIARADNQLTVMAGLWDGWQSKTSGEKIRSCTILTTEANDVMAKIHNHGKRMPVILDEKDWPLWLGEVEADLGDAKALIRPCPSEKLKTWPIGQAIGSSKRENNGPSLIEPATPI